MPHLGKDLYAALLCLWIEYEVRVEPVWKYIFIKAMHTAEARSRKRLLKKALSTMCRKNIKEIEKTACAEKMIMKKMYFYLKSFAMR